MKLRAALFSIFSLWLCTLGVWVVILFNVDPNKADTLTMITFVASLFLWVSSILTLIEYFIHIRLNKSEMIYAPLPIASRHGIMVGLTIALLLSLQLLQILNLADAILIIAIIALSELYFKGIHHAKPNSYKK